MAGVRARRRGAWRWPVAAAVAAALSAALGGCGPAAVMPDEASLTMRAVEGNVFDTAPVRGELRPLRHRKAGFEYKCSECHFGIDSPRRQNPNLPEHANVALEHGLNTNCQNCHHPSDRNVYIDREGNVIAPETPVVLCSQCHGPTYRDWELGIHGRQNGYWDVARGARTKLLCIQCHDPHSPAFKPMTPEPPAPRTRFETAAASHEEGHP